MSLKMIFQNVSWLLRISLSFNDFYRLFCRSALLHLYPGIQRYKRPSWSDWTKYCSIFDKIVLKIRIGKNSVSLMYCLHIKAKILIISDLTRILVPNLKILIKKRIMMQAKPPDSVESCVDRRLRLQCNFCNKLFLDYFFPRNYGRRNLRKQFFTLYNF